MNQLVTLKEAAELLNVDESVVLRRVDAREIHLRDGFLIREEVLACRATYDAAQKQAADDLLALTSVNVVE